ncbi:carboxymuconolactone decarboxylase family protein [Streptomyces sp. N35]|uniref:carboxymuconolactone decarboxylase family protein n=1 Tax=Streptomyces sp. N35 TaxID=2795730 RepID=UPI0018F6077D|nr:carboxymuconolactone decarboxylase family protein [Streptomyces sp. N35]
MSDQQFRAALEAAYRIGGKDPTDTFLAALAELSPALGRHIVTYIYGDLHQRPQFSTAERELMTLVVLATLGGCEREIALHAGVGLDAGLAADQIVEAFVHVGAYAGTPRAVNAVLAVRRTLAERGLLPVPDPAGPPL